MREIGDNGNDGGKYHAANEDRCLERSLHLFFGEAVNVEPPALKEFIVSKLHCTAPFAASHSTPNAVPTNIMPYTLRGVKTLVKSLWIPLSE